MTGEQRDFPYKAGLINQTAYQSASTPMWHPFLLGKIPTFSTFQTHRNKTADQNTLKAFSPDSEDHGIKSQEVMG